MKIALAQKVTTMEYMIDDRKDYNFCLCVSYFHRFKEIVTIFLLAHLPHHFYALREKERRMKPAMCSDYLIQTRERRTTHESMH